MRKIILFMTMLLSFSAFGQIEISFEDVDNKVPTRKGAFDRGYKIYTSKDGFVYRVGDKILIGNPSEETFVSIYKHNKRWMEIKVGEELSKTSAIIKKMEVVGNKRNGYKVIFYIGGAEKYIMDIEEAIQADEIKMEGISSEEALIELRRAKEKLELGAISQEEYNSKLEELKKYIK